MMPRTGIMAYFRRIPEISGFRTRRRLSCSGPEPLTQYQSLDKISPSYEEQEWELRLFEHLPSNNIRNIGSNGKERW